MRFCDVMFDVGYQGKTGVWGEWGQISMGGRFLPGRVVFRVSRIVKVIPVVVSCIHEVSSLESV